jgi:hypothetical protein
MVLSDHGNVGVGEEADSAKDTNDPKVNKN